MTPALAACDDPRSIVGEGEEPWLAEMDWAVPKYSRNQVDKAGDILAAMDEYTADEVVDAYDVLNNWRASHSFPLNNFQNNLRSKVKRIETGATVAQRIKRLESIIRKLRREQTKTMQLSQMQDIGGCRAIVQSISSVNKIVASYNRSSFLHKLKGKKDYIASPKADGYRGHHLIYQYQSLPEQITAYDNLRIEIQIRTALQHAWATAVEAVGAFTRQALKSSQGDQEWLQLFALMGAVMARIEKTPTIPGTPENWDQLKQEITALATKLHAVDTLEAHSATLNFAGTLKPKTSTYLLVHYDYADQMVYATSFPEQDSQKANAYYTEKEKTKKEDDNIVLVKVDSLRALKRAYPNFFLDTRQFTEILKGVLAPPPSSVAAQPS